MGAQSDTSRASNPGTGKRANGGTRRSGQTVSFLRDGLGFQILAKRMVGSAAVWAKGSPVSMLTCMPCHRCPAGRGERARFIISPGGCGDEAHQLEIRERVARGGAQPTPVIDRFWFKSVYFREPGGVLFELATDGPGFGVDEEQAKLGESLVLPPWLETDRDAIAAVLPKLISPNETSA